MNFENVCYKYNKHVKLRQNSVGVYIDNMDNHNHWLKKRAFFTAMICLSLLYASIRIRFIILFKNNTKKN